MKKETEIDKENVRLTYFHRQNQNVPNPTKCQKILSAIFSLCSAKAIKVEHRSLMDIYIYNGPVYIYPTISLQATAHLKLVTDREVSWSLDFMHFFLILLQILFVNNALTCVLFWLDKSP